MAFVNGMLARPIRRYVYLEPTNEENKLENQEEWKIYISTCACLQHLEQKSLKKKFNFEKKINFEFV